MANRVGYVKRATICAQIQIARVCALKVRRARRYLCNLSEERAGVHAKSAYLIFEAVSNIEPCAILVEDHLLTIEACFKLADDRIRSRINHACKVAKHVQHDCVIARVDCRVEWRDFHANWARPATLSLRAQVYPCLYSLCVRIKDGYAPIRIAFSAGKRDVEF